MTELASETKQPAGDHRWLILVVVAIAQLMVVLDATVVNIALPSAQRALGFANGDRQWVVTAYALAFGGLLLLGGRIGDIFSRKWVFVTGLLGFAGSSALGGAVTSFGMLVTARALQGGFGAILAPAALGTLVSTFRDPRERGRAFGVFGSVAGAGGAVGLILGGFLTQDLSWRWTLYVNLFFAALALAGALAYMSGGRPAARPRIDWTGALLSGAGLFLIVFGFSHAEAAGWGAPVTIGSLVLGAASLAAFGFAQQRGSHPLLPLRVVLDRTRGGAYAAVGLASISLFGTLLFLTYYLQTIKGYDPVTTGLAFLPMVGGLLVSANASSVALLPRIGPRVLIASGMTAGAAAMVYLTQLGATSGYASGVLPALILLGLGFGMILAPSINTATAGVRPQDSGVASALVSTMQQVGGSIGAAALSTIALDAAANYLTSARPSPLALSTAAVHGYTVAFAVSAVVFGFGAVLVFTLLPGKERLRQLRTAAVQATAARATAGQAVPAQAAAGQAAPGNPAPVSGGRAGQPVTAAAGCPHACA